MHRLKMEVAIDFYEREMLPWSMFKGNWGNCATVNYCGSFESGSTDLSVMWHVLQPIADWRAYVARGWKIFGCLWWSHPCLMVLIRLWRLLRGCAKVDIVMQIPISYRRTVSYEIWDVTRAWLVGFIVQYANTILNS